MFTFLICLLFAGNQDKVHCLNRYLVRNGKVGFRIFQSIAVGSELFWHFLLRTFIFSDGQVYPFGFISLCNKRSPPVIGTQVEFQVAKVSNSIDRAANLLIVKDIVVGRVDTMKGSYGFIEVEEKEKKVYFRYYFNITCIVSSNLATVKNCSK